MTLPAFFPNVRYVPRILEDGISLEEVCALAQTPCKASGRWTQRQIVIQPDDTPFVQAEPGDWAKVKIGTPADLNERDSARWALGVLAYLLFDGVARASVKGLPWSRVAMPTGPAPKSVRPLTNAERQRRHRQLSREA